MRWWQIGYYLYNRIISSKKGRCSSVSLLVITELINTIMWYIGLVVLGSTLFGYITAYVIYPFKNCIVKPWSSKTLSNHAKLLPREHIIDEHNGIIKLFIYVVKSFVDSPGNELLEMLFLYWNELFAQQPTFSCLWLLLIQGRLRRPREITEVCMDW